MNCFVFYVVVDGVACVPILLFRPWECLSLSLSQVGVLCVGPSVGPGVRLAATAGARFCYRRALLCACVCRTALSCFINMNARTPSPLPLSRLIASVI